MARRKFNPLPQTVRDDGFTRYRVLFRVSQFGSHPARPANNGWITCYLPKDVTRIKPVPAAGLTKTEAEKVIQYWQTRPSGDTFEYKLEPDQTADKTIADEMAKEHQGWSFTPNKTK